MLTESVVGNTGYFAKIRPDSIEPVDPRRIAAATMRISGSAEPVEKFDATTKGKALIVEQIIRPTGLLDPKISIRPLKTQIDDTIELFLDLGQVARLQPGGHLQQQVEPARGGEDPLHLADSLQPRQDRRL